MSNKKFYKYISIFIVITLFFTTITGVTSAEGLYTNEQIVYSQDFGEDLLVAPEGWTIPNGINNLKFNMYSNIPAGAPDSVRGIAVNAIASGPGNRPAYVDINPDIIMTDWVQDYEVFDFDFYMTGGVNTCNIFTLGNNQVDSCTDLSNTFFALGNGDGVGARNTLRYYNYDTDSWVSIPDVNEKWLKVKVYADFVNKKMAFDLKDAEGVNLGTFGPFSFSSKFTNVEPFLNRMVMSAFRTNGGSVTLNTWIDNFTISTMDTDHINFLNYDGIIPQGVLGTDYVIESVDGKNVLKTISRASVQDSSTDVNMLRVIDTDFMLTQLPTTGYQSIFSFDNDVNGNVMVDISGKLVSQFQAGIYNSVVPTGKKIDPNQWYNIKAYVFLTTPTETAYYTLVVTGNFGDGIETVEQTFEARNSDRFKKLNLQIGGLPSGSASNGNVFFYNTSLSVKPRPDIKILYGENGNVTMDENEVINGYTCENTVPKSIRIVPKEGYDVDKVMLNNKDVTSDISIDLTNGYYTYTVELKGEDTTISITYKELEENLFTTTQEDEPYSLDPSQSWDIRKYASEARTLQINRTKPIKQAYRLYKPVEYDLNSEQKYPLVVSLRAHGEGNTGFDNEPYTAGHVEDVLTSGQNALDFPCFILSPQCYDEYWASNNNSNIEMMLIITRMLIEEFENIDPNRIYIGGISDGAGATWQATALEPDLFAAAFIMSGTAPSTEYANLYVNTPIWTFYALDEGAQRVPITNIAMEDAVNQMGGNIISTRYATGGHIIAWTEGMNSPLFQWLFSKEKGNYETNQYVDRIISDYNSSLNSDLNIGYSIESEINNDNCKIQETMLGNIVADAMKEYTGADIALMSSSDLGESINAGVVSEENILNALPVKLTTSVVELKGSDILKLLTNSLSYYPVEDGRFLQVSGLTITFNPELRPSQRISSVLVNGEQIDSEKTYRVATTNHLISNKLNYTYSGDISVVEKYYRTVAQMFVSYLNKYNYNTLDVQAGRINIQTN